MSVESLDLNDPEVVKAIKEAGFVSSADVSYDGYVKADEVERLIEEAKKPVVENKNSILEEKRELKEKLDKLTNDIKGLNIDEAKQLLEKYETVDLVKMAVSGDLDGIKKQLASESAEEAKQLRDALSKAEQERQKREQELIEEIDRVSFEKKTIDIRREIGSEMNAMKNLIQATAFSEIERDALEAFDYDEEGKLVIKDAKGVVMTTANGNMTAAEWLKKMMDDKPHRFVGASGGGRKADKAPTTDQHGKPLFGMARLAEKRRRERQQG